MAKKPALPFTPVLRSAIQVLLQNTNPETGFQNPDAKSTVGVLGTTSGDVLTVMLSSVSCLNFYKFILSGMVSRSLLKN